MKAIILAGAACLLTSAWAGDDLNVKDRVLEIADDIALKNLKRAQMRAKELAAKLDEIDHVMNLLRPRKGRSPGLGVGPIPGAIKPDGIELKLVALSQAPLPANALAKEALALERMAQVIGAVSEVAHARPPKKDSKNWLRYASETRDAAAKLAAAARAMNPVDIQFAARETNNGCNNCHTRYK